MTESIFTWDEHIARMEKCMEKISNEVTFQPFWSEEGNVAVRISHATGESDEISALELMSQSKTRRKIVSLAGPVMPKMQPATYFHFIKAIMDIPLIV